MMSYFEKMYFTLFNAVTDALAAMEAQNYGTARTLLIEAQQKAEEAYCKADEESANRPNSSRGRL